MVSLGSRKPGPLSTVQASRANMWKALFIIGLYILLGLYLWWLTSIYFASIAY